MYIFSRIFKKREFHENMFSAKISTFTVLGGGGGSKLYKEGENGKIVEVETECGHQDIWDFLGCVGVVLFWWNSSYLLGPHYN